MMLKIIPGMRVNYNLISLLYSFLFRRKGCNCRESVKQFFSSYFEGRPTMLTASGRSAIYIILKSLPQKKVFIPAYTCNVVAEAAIFANKEIHFVHTSSDTFNSDNYEDADNDSIIVATHQYGLACNIEAINSFCKKTNAILIEDCAQAFGTKVGTNKVGSYGDYAIFSFNLSKLLTLPDSGGVIISKNETMMLKLETQLDGLVEPSLMQDLVTLRHGIISCLLNNSYVARLFHYWFAERSNRIQPYEHSELSKEMDVSYYVNISEWKCALLMTQIKQIDRIIEWRKHLFNYYDQNLHSSLLVKPICSQDSVCCRYTIKVHNRIYFYNKCLNNGIGLEFSHRFIAAPNEFVSEHQLANTIVNLPFYYKLSEREAKKIIKRINAF